MCLVVGPWHRPNLDLTHTPTTPPIIISANWIWAVQSQLLDRKKLVRWCGTGVSHCL
ncbi:hypothetical protein PISMIDRAFT_677286 [Pisolithus microcarpus 441]|uniref:Unplaced genomic scaffold scaffold_25, whole genome shotgun sequence n=1 Tax=Pisolithus microcarpus 441 TaxID=765257 RepID=A0A0C9ZZQ9_9AGAM|nr:hypothetical protein PISMIDRAFT_677286 [Pisolithus microcarpus 441]